MRSLISDNNRHAENFSLIHMRMTIQDLGPEFLSFMFEIVDEGFFIEFQNGDYDYNATLKQFDGSLSLEDRLKVLDIVGNDMFEHFASEDHVWKENPEMIAFLIHLVIESHLYVSVEHSDIKYNEKFT